jgi:hypothetical protein
VQGAVWVTAYIFPVADDRRLVPKERGGAYVELQYQVGTGWTSRGWRADEYGEFDHLTFGPLAPS